MTLRTCTLAAALLTALPSFAQISDGVVRLGVINDQSGPYAALTLSLIHI